MLEGAQIGQYRVVRKIGEGGMGAVFLAQHALIGRRAAIKVLLPALSQQHAIVERFFNEARATTAIPDPGIVQVFDFGFAADQSAYIVMEFLEGEPLDQRLKRLGQLAPSDALRITRQAAGSLAAAHARNIVHRDLKPDNLFMVRDPEAPCGERPKILDFGIAKLGGDEPGRMRTRTGTVMGTPVYMSPEQCRGAGELDHRSDIYSLGCVLFHLITGRPPFDMEGMGEILSAHLREPPRPPSALTLGITPDLDELVLRCLAKAPGERFQTMGELQHACDALLARITANGAGAGPLALATPFAPGFRSVSPGASAAVVATTTLGSAAGQALTGVGKRTALYGGLAALVAGGAIAIAVAARGGRTGAAPLAAALPDAAPIAAVLPDAAPIAAVLPDAAPIAAVLPDAAPVAAVSSDAALAPPKRRAASTRTTRSEDLYDDR